MAFYNGDAFNNSAAGIFLASMDPEGVGINLDATQVVAVAAFLRVINALENIRQSIELLKSAGRNDLFKKSDGALEFAIQETDDSIAVLAGAGLNPQAVAHLKRARRLTQKAIHSHNFRLLREAISEQQKARQELVEIS